VSPDDGAGFTACIDNGTIMFLLKDNGVWALTNADSDPLDWSFPRCDADIGTVSPNTVKLARYGNQEGVIYLGTDKTLRFINASISRNSGQKPTLTGGNSIIISDNFKGKLDTISANYLKYASAGIFGRYYVLSFPSEISTDNSMTIIIDTEKLLPAEGGRAPQPFWFEATNYDYSMYYNHKKDTRLYGINKNAFICNLLQDDYFYDDVPTRMDSNGYEIIEYRIHTGWQSYGDYEVELARLGVNYSGNYPLDIIVNSFRFGDNIPVLENGVLGEIVNDTTGNTTLKQFPYKLKGNYFSFGAYNNTAGESHTLLGFYPILKSHRRTQASTNK
jgi:hypothetical protein